MKIIITIILGLFSILCFGQEINNELPLYSPQTPTTADLGKYGDVQVNESTGVISPSIPLFEYSAGKMNIPIALNYSGNGVRVNQDPTWAGVNWNINPGGVITRVVRDKTDELTDISNRKYFSEQELEGLNGVRAIYPGTHDLMQNTDWYIAMNHLTFENTDSELDLFNYNFMGYSGTFFLDKNNQAHLIKYDKEVNIVFNFALNYDTNNVPISQSEIIIITPDGNRYYFGGPTASESSRVFVADSPEVTANLPYSQNAFYLYQISLLNGGTVNFEYDNYDLFCGLNKIGLQESASVSTPLGNHPCNKTTKILVSDVQNLVKLKRITNSFNNQVAAFESSSEGTCGRLTKLNHVLLKNGTQLAKKIKLVYLTINNEPIDVLENKFFLTKVEFYNKSSEFEFDYELNYQTPEIFPSKKSFAQDHLGYYNGKNSNTTLLPKTSTSILNLNCHFGLADREANVAASLIGSLQSIKYPTGGYTQFEYELPYKAEIDVFESHLAHAYYRNQATNRTSTTHICSANINSYSDGFFFPGNFNEPLHFQITHTLNATVTIQINGSYSHPVKARIIAKNANNIEFTGLPMIINGGVYDNETMSEALSIIDLQPGDYTFKFVLEIHAADSHNCDTQTENIFNSVNAIADFAFLNGTRSGYHPGLRIKRAKTYENDTDLVAQTTRYFYNSIENRNVESFVFEPKYVQKTWRLQTGNVAGVFVEKYNLNTNSVNNIFNNDMGSFTYEYVTTSYGGDNFENGGKESKFKKTRNLIPQLYKTHPSMFDGYYVYGWSAMGGVSGGEGETTQFGDNLNVDVSTAVDVTTNESYENSMLIQERTFNKDLKLLKSSKFNYEGTEHVIGNSMKVANLAEISILGAKNITYWCFMMYKTKTFKYRLKSTETTEYFGANYIDEVKAITEYEYKDDKVSLPSVVKTTNSLGELKQTNLYYPTDIDDLNTLQYGDMSYLNALIQKHNVSQLVRTENLLNGQVLGTKQISFGHWGTKVLPKSIKTSKGAGENELEERLEFYSYIYDQPSLLSLKDGTKIRYDYNNNQQVVRKSEYYGLTEIPEEGPLNNEPSSPCQNPLGALVTTYEYDSVTNNLIKITDPKCSVTTFYYDKFNRLKQIRDNEGNLISENEYHYKP